MSRTRWLSCILLLQAGRAGQGQAATIDAGYKAEAIFRRQAHVSSPTDWEKKKDQANRFIYRKHGIPNAVHLGHTLTAQTSLGGKQRVNPGSAIPWPGLPARTDVEARRGGVIEVCSPGQLCRDVAAQMALAEARHGSVLWMAVGSQAAGLGSSVLRQVPNLTLQQRTIITAADSKAALQELLRLVRQQSYTMVVLDGVAGLAPPPPGSVISPGTVFVTPAQKAEAAAAPGSSFWPRAVARGSGTPVPINLKFLHNVLPLLMEEVLADLATSCGPELRTTTLLLNAYTWRERDQAVGAGTGSAAGGGISGRSRWARRAILRHADASLHVRPEAAGTAAGTAAGAAGPIRCLRAVLSRGGPLGEDGGELRTWSLNTPVHIASPSPGDNA